MGSCWKVIHHAPVKLSEQERAWLLAVIASAIYWRKRMRPGPKSHFSFTGCPRGHREATLKPSGSLPVATPKPP